MPTTGPTDGRPDAAALLAKLSESGRARLRVYIGAAPGVGKTYQMLEDAHAAQTPGLRHRDRLHRDSRPGRHGRASSRSRADSARGRSNIAA